MDFMTDFDIFSLVDKIEKTSPALSKKIGIGLLNWISPFNSHLRAQVIDWKPMRAALKIKCHRKVKNHIGGIHAGAIFTLGESCAGFVIIKNFSFKEFRPILTDVTVKFDKQAHGPITGVSELSKLTVAMVKKGLATGKPQFVDMETKIINEKKEVIALVKTKWQIKSWDQVKKTK